MLVTVPEEGVYGFLMKPRLGGAGRPPLSGEAPQTWIGVDITRPTGRITQARQGAGRDADKLFIAWEAGDNRALAERPISLSFSERAGGPWTVIAGDLPNTGQYIWQLKANLPQRAYLRLEVLDAAGNVGTFELPEPAALDLSSPSVPLGDLRRWAGTIREPTSGCICASVSSRYTAGMAKLHAFDYLAQSEKHTPRPVCVAYGDDLFLRRQVLVRIRGAVLSEEEADFSLTTFEGATAELRDVLEELDTVAMFGAQRLVVVEEADEFVSRYRQALEDYVAKPGRGGVLMLDVKTWPATTRLYKAVDAKGLAVDCSAPAAARLTRWLSDWAKQAHNVQLSLNAAETLAELVEPELGVLDQELAKLALVSGADKKITPDMVQKYVGGWRAKTTWEMLDLALDGNVPEALRQVDRLLSSGEVPIGILGQIASSLRRLAAATRLILRSEAAGRKIAVGSALQQAGVKPFVLQKAERQLRRIGRQRGGQLYRWLLETDLDLKGDSPMPPRLVLERLIVRLAAPA